MPRLGRIVLVVAVAGLLVGGVTLSASSADKAQPRDDGFEEDGSIPTANIVDIPDTYLPTFSSSGFITGPYVGRNEIGDGAHGSGGSATGDFDFYGLRVRGGDVLTVDVDAFADGTGLDPYIWLYDGAGNLIAENDDSFVASDVSAGYLDSHLEYVVPAPGGAFYVAVGGCCSPIGDPFDPTSGPGAFNEGEYEIHISAIPALHVIGGPLYVAGDAPADSVVVRGNGWIGLGTQTPEAPLEMVGGGGDTEIRVRDTSPTVGARTLFRLENNGSVRFQFRDTAANNTWQFQIGNNGAFGLSQQGTGGPELRVFEDGSVVIGPSGSQQFLLDPVGNLEVEGTVTDGSGNTLGDLLAENQALRDQLSRMERELSALRDVEARLAALEAQLGGG